MSASNCAFVRPQSRFGCRHGRVQVWLGIGLAHVGTAGCRHRQSIALARDSYQRKTRMRYSSSATQKMARHARCLFVIPWPRSVAMLMLVYYSVKCIHISAEILLSAYRYIIMTVYFIIVYIILQRAYIFMLLTLFCKLHSSTMFMLLITNCAHIHDFAKCMYVLQCRVYSARP